MKKLYAFYAVLLLSGCYHAVPAQQVYYEDTYATVGAPVAYDSSVYVVQEQPAVYYGTQTSVVYVDDGPDVIYYDSPFVAPRPYHYHHAPAPIVHHSHHAPHHTPHHSVKPHKAPAGHGAKSHNLPIRHGGKPERLPGKGASRHGGRK